MLAAMGVQVWYQRGVGVKQQPAEMQKREAAPAAPAAPVVEPDTRGTAKAKSVPLPQAKAQIVEFAWVKGQTGMLMCDVATDAVTLQLVRDIVQFGDFVRGQTEVVQPVGNEFRWPQLSDTGGTPLRALTVFLDKHLPAPGAWIALTPEVAPSIAKWLDGLPLTVIELPTLRSDIGDAATKKLIWQSLKTNA